MDMAELYAQISNMSCYDLIEFIYWDNHGDMDIERSDWTMAMLTQTLFEGFESIQHFTDSYDLFLARDLEGE